MLEPRNSSPADGSDRDYDVIVIGGAFAGAACATLLRRWSPAARVLIVEATRAFDRKVGEATVEVSGAFLHRVLGLYQLLNEEHLHKHGLRFWFSDEGLRSLAEMSEIGGRTVPLLPSFQLDRAKLDESLLAQARAAGAVLLRPARIVGVESGWPLSRVAVESAGLRREFSARWVVDASGRQAFLARRLGLLQKNERHPTSALWGRWTGVLDMDGAEVVHADPDRPHLAPVSASRRLGTNHFCGHGWWCWVIPLAGGDTSIGLVYDERHLRLPGAASLRDEYGNFLRSHSGLAELIGGAVLHDGDFKSYRHLAYCSRLYMKKGWAMVGDAASFIDPFYSPGLDHVSFSSYATARLVSEELGGRLEGARLDGAVETHNAEFLRYYERYFESLYLDKYELMGDFELMGAAYLLDTALFFMGVVRPTQRDPEEYRHPPLGRNVWQALLAWKLMSFYNRRLVALARKREALGTYGTCNLGLRMLGRSFDPGERVPHQFRQGMGLWARAEWRTFKDQLIGRERLARGRARASSSGPATRAGTSCAGLTQAACSAPLACSGPAPAKGCRACSGASPAAKMRKAHAPSKQT